MTSRPCAAAHLHDSVEGWRSSYGIASSLHDAESPAIPVAEFHCPILCSQWNVPSPCPLFSLAPTATTTSSSPPPPHCHSPHPPPLLHASFDLADVTFIVASVTAVQPVPAPGSTDSQPLTAAAATAAAPAAAAPAAAGTAAAAAPAGGKRGVLLLDNGQAVAFDECMWCTQVGGGHGSSVPHPLTRLINFCAICPSGCGRQLVWQWGCCMLGSGHLSQHSTASLACFGIWSSFRGHPSNMSLGLSDMCFAMSLIWIFLCLLPPTAHVRSHHLISATVCSWTRLSKASRSPSDCFMQGAAAGWLQHTGLALDSDGFIRVDACLQSVSHPLVFAAGDVHSSDSHPRPKAGVIAVRQVRREGVMVGGRR